MTSRPADLVARVRHTARDPRGVANPALRGWDLGASVRFGEGIERWRFVADAAR
jgi:hypothetical protein